MSRGEPIPPPTVGAFGMTAMEVARWHAEMAVLEADPRTSGGANRPRWLVKRVLEEARARGDL